MATSVTVPLELPAPRPRRRRSLRSLPLKAKIGGALLAVFLLIAIIGPTIAPYDASATTPQAVPGAPSLQHLLGTTSTGQDILSQMLVGMRSTVVLGLLTGLIATLLSIAFGVTAGFIGGATDEALSLVINVFLILPALPLLIILLGYLPANTGELPVAIVLSVLGWPWGARVIRAQTLTLRNREFVAAARETGEPTSRLIAFEILPNEVSLIAANFVGTVLYAILTSVALAFIGVAGFSGWSLGSILYWAQSQGAFSVGAWWWYVPPGIAAALLGTSLVLLNFGLDELANPRLRNAGARRRGRGRRRRQRSWRPGDPTPVERTEAAA
jgi:peptide/nickel transport system permease protein